MNNSEDIVLKFNYSNELPVYISHHSLESHILATVIGYNGPSLVIFCAEPAIGIQRGDPVILRYYHDFMEYVVTTDVREIVDTSTIGVTVLNISKFKNVRKHFRFPVSLSAVMTQMDNKESAQVSIKNLSASGLKLNSKVVLEMEAEISLLISTSQKIDIAFEGKVRRIKTISDYFEYGVELTHISNENQSKLEQYLMHLANTEEDFIRNTFI